MIEETNEENETDESISRRTEDENVLEGSEASNSEEVLLEPRLKYSRILNSVPPLLAKDQASCIAVHDKFVVIGTDLGYVYVFDHLGNLHPENTARHHRLPVSKISVDPSGSYFATCSKDARVSIAGIASTEYSQTVELKNAAETLAIAPDFAKQGSGQTFVTGDRSLTFHQRRFLGGYKEKIIYQGLERDGVIQEASWRGIYIAFTNDTGTRIYDRSSERVITLVKPLHDAKLKEVVQVRPSLCWIDNSTLAIGWYNTAIICVIMETNMDMVDVMSVRKTVEVNFAWKLDMFVADISYTLSDDLKQKWKEIVVFGKKISDNVIGDSSDGMVLALLEGEDLENFILAAEDRIEMSANGSNNLMPFHMCSLPYESLYFLLSSKEFIEARPCSADDLVRWFLENDMLRDAVQYAKEHEEEMNDLDATEIGKRYITSLMEQKRFADAAWNLRMICGRHKDLWEFYVNEFEQNSVVLQLAKYLPVKDPQLEPECYQSVLVAALYNHPVLFYNLTKVWSPDLFRVGAIIDLAMKRVIDEANSGLTERDATAIYRSLARLYLYERRFDKALMLYMTLNDKNVFHIIEKYHLFDLVKDDLAKLMAVDTDLTVRLLIENASSLPSKTVLTQISKYPKLQIAYLNSLFEHNEGDEFVDLAIRLYAEHEPKLLLPFLRKTERFDISKALDICEAKQYVNEMVYLLGKSGDRKRALDLLVHHLNRIDMAIDFCRESDDHDLWNALIDASVERPDLISEMLNTAGNYVNPLDIIEKIPDEMMIPGLRNSITKILRDYEMQAAMQRNCLEVTRDDTNILTFRYIAKCKRAIAVEENAVCSVCKVPLIHPWKGRSLDHRKEDLCVFGCGHVIHSRCTYVTNVDENEKRRTSRDSACSICVRHVPLVTR